MGTYYTFTINASNVDVLQNITSPSGLVGDIFRGGTEALYIKWPNHLEDMRVVSKEFPKVLFELSVVTEDSSIGMYRAYFLNGKTQVCPARIEFEPFDSAKLT